MDGTWGSKVYLAIKPVDMRRSFDGLSILIQTEFKKDVMTGSLFVFCNKNRDRIKLFYWDRNGFCMWYKRLSQGRYRFPKISSPLITMTMSDLTLLLEGIDLTHKQRLQAVI